MRSLSLRCVRLSQPTWIAATSSKTIVRHNSTRTHLSPLQEDYRHIMRAITANVVILTSPPATSRNSEPSKPRAMTLSSFTSLSISPTPLITFNIATPSRTLTALTENPRFNIHIPLAAAAGAKLAHRFTKGNSESMWEGLKWDEHGVIHDDGVMAVLKCRLAAGDKFPPGGMIQVGDHAVVVGKVEEARPGGDDHSALTHWQGNYRGYGMELDIP
ncbi:flavin reductase like domain-containing protein [Emericellopsis atlantica]|uniref:Flavin reductase like domain-containing protein n=1 Tax=Emericellopsis atlantica TaxID=2614577 RepID=A0A9P7ZK18_9HYPO|nr:flavin reductase like domain-containing protein [Emericellopsis atlantica]KAG9253112.1 flavin reductase like domain-containing protein [Emericellopsis atlantica]